MAEGVLAAMVPRILVVIAGLGSLSRVPPVAMSMRLIASDASVNMSCLMYIYGTEEAVPSATLAAEVPSCRVVRSTGGMLSQLLRVPDHEINLSQAVLIMPSSVQLTADVSLSLMWRIMRANGLDVAVAACDTCKSKRLINRDFSQAVGRRMPLPDLQATLFTPPMYLCLKRLANETIHLDRFAWATLAMFPRVCSPRTGVIDAMSTHKFESGNTYNWTDAMHNYEDVLRIFHAKRPEWHLLDPLDKKLAARNAMQQGTVPLLPPDDEPHASTTDGQQQPGTTFASIPFLDAIVIPRASKGIVDFDAVRAPTAMNRSGACCRAHARAQPRIGPPPLLSHDCSWIAPPIMALSRLVPSLLSDDRIRLGVHIVLYWLLLMCAAVTSTHARSALPTPCACRLGLGDCYLRSQP